MDRMTANELLAINSVDLDELKESSVDEIIEMVARIDWGEGQHTTDEQLDELRKAILYLRNN